LHKTITCALSAVSATSLDIRHAHHNGGEPHVSQPKETSMREKIIPKDSIPEPPPPTWQPDPAGGWEKGGVWVVPIDGGMWGARWSIDGYDGWSAPFGTFDTAEAAMQAVDDGYEGWEGEFQWTE
jgi:hypothetical protein